MPKLVLSEEVMNKNYSEQLFYKYLLHERIKTMGLSEVPGLEFKVDVFYRSMGVEATFQGMRIDTYRIFSIYQTYQNRTDYILSALYSVVTKLLENVYFRKAYADIICLRDNVIPVYYIGFGAILKEYWSSDVPAFEVVYNCPRLKHFVSRDDRLKVSYR